MTTLQQMIDEMEQAIDDLQSPEAIHLMSAIDIWEIITAQAEMIKGLRHALWSYHEGPFTIARDALRDHNPETREI